MKYLIGLFSFFALFNAHGATNNIPAQKQPQHKRMHNPALKNVNTLGLNKRSAARKVSQEYPGKVLNVKESSQFYKVRMLQPQGKVVDFKVLKSNGAIKKESKD